MSDLFVRMSEFAARLLSGGTLEIVLLIVLIIVGLILLLVALWILWKLLVLLGKGLLWLFRVGGEATQRHAASQREERLTAPPAVATAWGSAPRIRLRKALAEARRIAGPDALRVVLVVGDGMSDLCRSCGMIPPGMGTISIAASNDLMLIDASRASNRMMRRLAAALPWRRSFDAVAAIVDPDSIPSETLVRAASLARATGLRAALHFVLASPSRTAAWRIVDPNDRDGGALCTQLGEDAARIWLTGGSRQDLNMLALAQSRDLPSALDRAFATAPSSSVDIASLSFGGAGLRAAVAQAASRTRPADTPGLPIWTGFAVLIAGAALAGLAAVIGLDRASGLRATLSTAEREASTSWLNAGIDAVPSGSRIRRMSGVGARLAEYSGFSALTPLAVLVPNYHAPERLGAALMDAYVLRPLAAALDRRSREQLAPSDDPVTWLGNTRLVGEWLAAWEGLEHEPMEVDVRRLFSAAFGGDPDAWSEGTDLALVRTGVRPPPPAQGGLDVDGLTDLARRSFIATMQLWADKVYTNGPVATAARRAGQRSAPWREQHDALAELRTALQDPGQVWMTAVEDRPDYGFELRMYGRALALSVLGQASALEAKAAVSRIRIDARKAAEHSILPEIGPLMVRSSSGSRGAGGGPSLSLSPQAQAWLAFLGRIRNSEFADLPQARPLPISGEVTIDPVAVADTRAKLRVFDRFAAVLPADLPPSVAQALLREVTSELVIGVAAGVELALRPGAELELATEQALHLSRMAPALEDLKEIDTWLLQRHATAAADRVLEVRARVAETVLRAGRSVLEEEDPVGIYLDPAADAGALLRRFGRGVVRLRRVYELFAGPYLEAAAAGGKMVAFEWKRISEDIAGYDRGDDQSALTGLEAMLAAYADDSAAACEAPLAMHAAPRYDYVARALSRFRNQLEQTCMVRELAGIQEVYGSLAEYFTRHVAWLWPYATDRGAPELPASTLSEFLGLIDAAQDRLGRVEGEFVDTLQANARFWSHDDGGDVGVRFRIDWRARPEEEQLAEHVIGFELDGVEIDEGGFYTWRYGVPVTLRLRLAKNSPYRFVGAADAEGIEFVIAENGNGALIRLFEGLSGGAMTFGAKVVDALGKTRPLRVTARIADAGGAPMTMPQFSDFPPHVADIVLTDSRG